MAGFARRRWIWALLAALPAAGFGMDAAVEPVRLSLVPAESALMLRPPSGVFDPERNFTGAMPELVLPPSLRAALDSLPDEHSARVLENLNVAAWSLLKAHPHIAILHKPGAPHALLIPNERSPAGASLLGVAVRIPTLEEAVQGGWSESEFRHFEVTRGDAERWEALMRDDPLGVDHVAESLREADGPSIPPEHAEKIVADMTGAVFMTESSGDRWLTRAAAASRVLALRALETHQLERFRGAAREEIVSWIAASRFGEAQRAINAYREMFARMEDADERRRGEGLLQLEGSRLYIAAHLAAAAARPQAQADRGAPDDYDPGPFERSFFDNFMQGSSSFAARRLVDNVARDARQAGDPDPTDTAEQLILALMGNGRLKAGAGKSKHMVYWQGPEAAPAAPKPSKKSPWRDYLRDREGYFAAITAGLQSDRAGPARLTAALIEAGFTPEDAPDLIRQWRDLGWLESIEGSQDLRLVGPRPKAPPPAAPKAAAAAPAANVPPPAPPAAPKPSPTEEQTEGKIPRELIRNALSALRGLADAKGGDRIISMEEARQGAEELGIDPDLLETILDELAQRDSVKILPENQGLRVPPAAEPAAEHPFLPEDADDVENPFTRWEMEGNRRYELFVSGAFRRYFNAQDSATRDYLNRVLAELAARGEALDSRGTMAAFRRDGIYELSAAGTAPGTIHFFIGAGNRLMLTAHADGTEDAAIDAARALRFAYFDELSAGIVTLWENSRGKPWPVYLTPEFSRDFLNNSKIAEGDREEIRRQLDLLSQSGTGDKVEGAQQIFRVQAAGNGKPLRFLFFKDRWGRVIVTNGIARKHGSDTKTYKGPREQANELRDRYYADMNLAARRRAEP